VVEDPGWVAALGGFWRTLFVPSLSMRTRRGRSTPVLLTMRTMVVSAIVSWLILLNVVLYLFRGHAGNSVTLMTIVVAGDGVLTLLLVSRLRSRPPSGADAVSLASEYRARFFLSWASTNAVVLVGVVGAIIGRPWIFAIALPVGALCLAMIAPSRAAIEHDQARLGPVHGTINLLGALMLPNGEVPQRVKKR
jgi:hypothetical protein